MHKCDFVWISGLMNSIYSCSINYAVFLSITLIHFQALEKNAQVVLVSNTVTWQACHASLSPAVWLPWGAASLLFIYLFISVFLVYLEYEMFFWNPFSCSCSESVPEPLSWSFLLPWLCSGTWLRSGADPRGPLANAPPEVEISTLK